MKVIVLGNGIAGVLVASELRRIVADCSITIFSTEPYPYYFRIKLPEAVAEGLDIEALAAHPPEWYARRSIESRTGMEAISIDTAAKTVAFADGSAAGYDYLVLALGADSNRPPIPGAELRGCFTLRSYDDAASLRSWALARDEPVACLGGGLLGLEAASALRAAGARKVTVFELFPRLLPRQLDVEGARLLRKILEAKGLDFVLPCETEAVLGASRCEGLRLKDGRIFGAGTILFSMGVRPRIALAKAAGIATNKGILVDGAMRTSAPGVFAAGDCAEFSGSCPGTLPVAMEQAPVAARSVAEGIAGREPAVSYAGTAPRNVLKVSGVDLCSVGEAATLQDPASEGYSVLSRSWEAGEMPKYEKYLLKDGKLAGAIILGSRENALWAARTVGKGAGEGEVLDRMEGRGGGGRE